MPSKDTIRLNPHFYGAVAETQPKAQSPVSDASRFAKGDRGAVKRIRQDTKPLLNKLETEWLENLVCRMPGRLIYSQSMRFKLANGAWYKPDFFTFELHKPTAWEVKGPKQGKNVDRGMLTIKCAASRYPDVEWILVWKENGQWKQQVILP